MVLMKMCWTSFVFLFIKVRFLGVVIGKDTGDSTRSFLALMMTTAVATGL